MTGGEGRLAARPPDRVRLLSAVQHEVNTPLAVIRGWAETLTDLWDSLSPDEREMGVRTILKSIEELSEFLGGAFAEIRSENLARAPDLTVVDAAEIVDRVLDRSDRVAAADSAAKAPVRATPTGLETLIDHLVDAHRGRASDAPTEIAVRNGSDGVAIVVRTPGAAPFPDVDPSDPLNPRDESAVALRLLAVRSLTDAFGAEVIVRHDDVALVTEVRLPPA